MFGGWRARVEAGRQVRRPLQASRWKAVPLAWEWHESWDKIPLVFETPAWNPTQNSRHWFKLFNQETRAPRVITVCFSRTRYCRILFPVGRIYFLFFLIEWPVGHILRMVWVFAWGPHHWSLMVKLFSKLPLDIWNLFLKKISNKKKKSHISLRQAALGNQASPNQDPRSILEYSQNLFGI